MIALRFKKDKHSWEQLNSLMSHREEWAKNPTWKEQHQHALGLFHSALNPLMCPRRRDLLNNVLRLWTDMFLLNI